MSARSFCLQHSNACQKTATKRERQEQKREQRREQDLYRIENEKRKSVSPQSPGAPGKPISASRGCCKHRWCPVVGGANPNSVVFSIRQSVH